MTATISYLYLRRIQVEASKLFFLAYSLATVRQCVEGPEFKGLLRVERNASRYRSPVEGPTNESETDAGWLRAWWFCPSGSLACGREY